MVRARVQNNITISGKQHNNRGNNAHKSIWLYGRLVDDRALRKKYAKLKLCLSNGIRNKFDFLRQRL